MYRKFYLNYLALNILISAIVILIAMYPKNLLFNYWMVGLSWVLGIFLMHFFILNLPVFRDFYINRSKLTQVVIQARKYNQAEHKAAPVMSGLVVFICVCGVLTGGLYMCLRSVYGLNLTEYFVEYAFITAISTGNMSYYYTP